MGDLQRAESAEWVSSPVLSMSTLPRMVKMVGKAVKDAGPHHPPLKALGDHEYNRTSGRCP